jgi:hypothetical protein
VAQTFLSADSRDILVPSSGDVSRTGEWKVAGTRRLESPRYNAKTAANFQDCQERKKRAK